MKKTALLILFSTLLLFSCKKDEPIAPELQEHAVSISISCNICFVSFMDDNDEYAIHVAKGSFTKDLTISGRRTFDVNITTVEPQDVKTKVAVNGKVSHDRTVPMGYDDTQSVKIDL